MSLFGDAFGRALAGIGSAGEQLANKYINEELLQQRMQAQADIQFQGKVREEEYVQSDAVQTRRRLNRANDVISDAAAADTATLNRAKNDALTRATIDQTNALTEGTSASKAAAAGALKRAESLNTLKDLKPGDEAYIGSERIAGNARKTPQEVQDDLFREGLKGDGAKPAKLSKEAEIQLKSLFDEEKALEKQWSDQALMGAKEDASNPGYQHYVKRKNELRIERMRLLAREGAIDGAEDARRAVASETIKGPQDIPRVEAMIRQGMKQAEVIGSDYAKDFSDESLKIIEKMKDPDLVRSWVKSAASRRGDANFVMDIGGVKQTVGNVSPVSANVATEGVGQPSIQAQIDAAKKPVDPSKARSLMEISGVAARDADLAALRRKSDALIKSGNAAAANQALAEMKRLRMERYGF